MVVGAASYGFALLAGLVATLSPCVLPIVPIVLGSAVTAHPHGPLALAAGLALSYAVIGSALAWAGSALGVDASSFRDAGAVILGAFGLVLVSARLQRLFAAATAGLGDAGNRLAARIALDGLGGQFAIGALLGVVWSPCVGPTLGAAILLASQGRELPQVALLMGVFGVGTALPVLALAYLSRSALARARSGLLQAGRAGQVVLGAALVAVAVLVVAGADRSIEAWLVDRSPDWLTRLTTSF